MLYVGDMVYACADVEFNLCLTEDEDIQKPRESMLGEGDLPPQVAAAYVSIT